MYVLTRIEDNKIGNAEEFRDLQNLIVASSLPFGSQVMEFDFN